MSGNEASVPKSKFSACKSTQSRCALCYERMKDVHSHPGQWKSDLQQFLLQYTTIPLTSCVCRADPDSIKKGLGLGEKLMMNLSPDG